MAVKERGPTGTRTQGLSLTVRALNTTVKGRFGLESFRPWVVSALGRFGPGSFRPMLVGHFGLILLKFLYTI